MGIIPSFNPPNQTVILKQRGTVNVTFECSFEEGGGNHITLWNVLNFRGEKNAQDIKTVLPDTILEGELTPEFSFFRTFRTRLTFPLYLEDFHEATLTCGWSESHLFSGQFPLRSCSKVVSLISHLYLVLLQ